MKTEKNIYLDKKEITFILKAIYDINSLYDFDSRTKKEIKDLMKMSINLNIKLKEVLK